MWKYLQSKVVLFVLLGLVVVVVVLLIFNETRLKPMRVALTWLNQAQFAGIYVADAKDFYRNEGLEVHAIERDIKGPSPIELLREKKVDIAVISPGEFLRAASNGENVVALAVVYQSLPTVIASLEKTGIRSPKDLIGKKVGLTVVNEESKLVVNALLEKEGVQKNGPTFSAVGSNQVGALLNGDVDAVSIYRTNELYELDKKDISYSLIFPERFGVDIYADIIVVRKEYVLEHEKEIGGFLRATFKGWEFAEQDPDEATRITLNVDNPRYHDAEREAYILKNALKLIRQYPKQTMGQMIPLQWTYMYEQFRKHGLVSDIELDNFFVDWHVYERMGFPE
jgi:ABC-type nitrate/sulfonate/bicarbonate transport system substrate-binding protein